MTKLERGRALLDSGDKAALAEWLLENAAHLIGTAEACVVAGFGHEFPAENSLKDGA